MQAYRAQITTCSTTLSVDTAQAYAQVVHMFRQQKVILVRGPFGVCTAIAVGIVRSRSKATEFSF